MLVSRVGITELLANPDRFKGALIWLPIQEEEQYHFHTERVALFADALPELVAELKLDRARLVDSAYIWNEFQQGTKDNLLSTAQMPKMRSILNSLVEGKEVLILTHSFIWF